LTGMLTAALRWRATVLDGEVVVYNEAGQIDFGLLQQRRGRFQKHRTARCNEPFTDVPVRFLAFDLLQLDEQLLLEQPYGQRRPVRISRTRPVALDIRRRIQRALTHLTDLVPPR
jgi:bifunctional non-homologous end joining protein LigD